MEKEIVGQIPYLEEAQLKFKNSYKALEMTKLMADVSIDPDEALRYQQSARGIGRVRFGLWLDLNRPIDNIPLR